MKVSIVIPVYNESRNLSEFLDAIDTIDLGVEKEIIFVDDCSDDGTAEILNGYVFQSEHRLLHQSTNKGKGASLHLGIKNCSGDIIGIQDADFEYDFNDIPSMISPIISGKYDIVYGCRFKKGTLQVHRTFHYLVNKVLTLLSNLFSGIYLNDMETCYKYFRADIIKNISLTSNRFGFEPEITAKISNLNVNIAEVPISYFPRTHIDGKKIGWRDGVAAIWHIVYFNVFNRKNLYLSSMPSKYIARRST
jgi:glycosyltransferase involved in cell wall biosynthesis